MKTHKLVVNGQKERNITKDMIGLFFEDINFAADGGLYAEMIENRSFEAIKSMGGSFDYVMERDPFYAWSLIGESAKAEISENSPVSENNPHYLRFTAGKPGEGFANKAYDGIVLKKGMTYTVSFFAREVKCEPMELILAVTKDGKTYAEGRIPFTPANPEDPTEEQRMKGTCKAREWRFYETIVTAEEDLTDGVFEIRLSAAGSMEFDLISVMPDDAVAGVFRKDIFEALAGVQPGFLRFPGGCIVEGTSIMRRYRWKDTVGPLRDRKINTNLWATQGGNTLFGREMQDSHYMQSYGIGFYEYFRLCELLSGEKRVCRPLPVVNIGVACQFRTFETVDMDSPEFQEYIQDALDLIEFANGDASTKWGGLRASMGHPQPFGLDMIAIGNEQWQSEYVDLFERYRRFESAIHAVYPDIKCLGTAGPFIKNESHKEAWDYYKNEGKEGFAYAVDEHYYVEPSWLYESVGMYDDYQRGIAVFAGEYAGHDRNLTNSVETALAEAAMLTGMERNGDLVQLASYAPLLNRIGHSQWTPDLIWFDAEKVVLTPNYFVQKLFSEHAGSEALELAGQEKKLRESQIYISLVQDGDDKILKIVNAALEDQELALEDEQGSAVAKDATKITFISKGEYKAPVGTKAVDWNGPNRAIDQSIMTNAELCEMRFPEEASVSEERVAFTGTLNLPAKSLTILRWA